MSCRDLEWPLEVNIFPLCFLLVQSPLSHHPKMAVAHQMGARRRDARELVDGKRDSHPRGGWVNSVEYSDVLNVLIVYLSKTGAIIYTKGSQYLSAPALERTRT